MAHVLAHLNHATTIVGGGDSASAVERAGVARTNLAHFNRRRGFVGISRGQGITGCGVLGRTKRWRG